MFDIGQGISYSILSTVLIISYILYFMIIWYIKTKPLGTITPFDKVTIDTILVRLFQLTLIYIGIFIYIIEECPTRDLKNILLSLANYILALLVMSSEILNSSFRILFLRKNQWLHETSDTKFRKIAWVIRVIIAGKVEHVLKGSLDSILSPSVKIQIMGRQGRNKLRNRIEKM
jgi:hypothetical protein